MNKSNDDQLDKLKEYRDTILLAEIGALIHDIGKLSEEFVEHQSKDKKKEAKKNGFPHHLILKRMTRKYHSYKKSKRTKTLLENEDRIHDNFLPNKLINLLNKSDLEIPSIGKCNLGDFIEQHHKPFWGQMKIPVRFLTTPGCDSIDSGIDKGAPIRKQKLNETYISTPYGYEKGRIALNRLKDYRFKFCKVLEKELQEIQNAENSDENQIEVIKDSRNNIIEAAEKYFSKTLGETRRAANDVTLWDHSYSVTSLYKSALAGIILKSNGKLPKPVELKWKILLISLDGLDFWMKSEKIGDILARKKMIEDCFKEVKKLLEEKIPLGNEIYKDENTIAFLVSDKLDLRDKYIEEEINKIFNEISKGEIKPSINLSPVSRGAANLGKTLNELKSHTTPDIQKISEHWEKVEKKKKKNELVDICHVCGLRAIGFPKDNGYQKAKRRNICIECLNRRKNRSKNWIDEERDKTIWMDEVADSNNRVAFIVGKFNLDNWLDGTNLNTIFTKTLFDLQNKNEKGIKVLNGYNDLLEATKQCFIKNNKEDNIEIDGVKIKIEDFLNSIGRDSYCNQPPRKKTPDEYFKALVLNREKEELEEELEPAGEWNIETKAKLLLSFLFRKNPSFARIRRIWDTTLNFWGELNKTFQNSETLQSRQRYEIEFGRELEIIESHTYYLKYSGIFLPTVATSDKKMLIVDTEENIPQAFTEELKENQTKDYSNLDIEVIVYESNKKDTVENSKPVKIERIKKDSEYTPFLNILKTPSAYISVVPADKAFSIVKKIKGKYEKEFSKVRNRLPINISLIFMNKKMPVFVAMDCARRFLNYKKGEEMWKVLGTCDTDLIENKFRKKRLTLKKKDKVFQADINYKLGNGEPDYYHPYYILERGNCPGERKTYFETYNDKKLVHIKDVTREDLINYNTSNFDFEFLDTNSRRFDITFDKDKKRPHTIFKKGPRPYLLEDIDIFKKIWGILEGNNINDTQLNNFESLLISKIEEWGLKDLEELSKNKTFKELVKTSIKNILRIKKEEKREEFNLIYDSVISGMFFDVKELYHSILKRKLGGENEQE